MIMKKIALILALITTGGVIFAQRSEDILRYSRISPDGTARTAAMGNAFGALGGDISTMHTNPAGIGVFRRSEVNLTPLLNFNRIGSESCEGTKGRLLLGNLGGVFSNYNPGTDWKGFNFAINYTTLNNYHRKMKQQVKYHDGMDASSWTQAVAIAGGNVEPKNLDPFTGLLAWETYLLWAYDDGYYESVLVYTEDDVLYFDPVDQYKDITETGYQGEIGFSWATNYKEQLYLGVTVGVQVSHHETRSTYREEGMLRAPSDLDYLQFDEMMKTTGEGVNLKVGAIYRPIPNVRFGLAIHTPTWYQMKYRRQTELSSQFFNQTDPSIGRDKSRYSARSVIDSYEYAMRTPWRAVVSAAGVIMGKGIVSLDYEVVDYGSGKYDDPDDYIDYYDYNRSVKNYYGVAHNFRLGAEYRVNSLISLRAGYGYQGRPYKEDGYTINNSIPGGEEIHSISAGFGLNFGNMYLDAAFTNKSSRDKTIFYHEDDGYYAVMAQPIKNKYRDNQLRFSYGIRF